MPHAQDSSLKPLAAAANPAAFGLPTPLFAAPRALNGPSPRGGTVEGRRPGIAAMAGNTPSPSERGKPCVPLCRHTASAEGLPAEDVRQAFAARHAQAQGGHPAIAQVLGLSEGALVAAQGGPVDRLTSPLAARRLRADGPALLAGLEACGELMAMTRNAHGVHEKVGPYRGVEGHAHVGLVRGGAIDLRLDFRHWAHAFAVEEQVAEDARHPDGVQRSLQVFDAQGLAVHEIVLRARSDHAAWRALVDRLATAPQADGGDDDPAAGPVARAVPPKPKPRPDDEIDRPAFHDAWASMRDTHDFAGLLERHGLTRTQGLRLAAPGYTQAVTPSCAQAVLQGAAQQGVSVMVVVGNRGTTQIHTGPIQSVAVRGPWLEVLDEGFTLRLREDRIAQAWVVRKPTSDGLVHSLELFDAEGDTIAMLLGERRPGQRERCDWRQLLDTVALDHDAPAIARCA